MNTQFTVLVKDYEGLLASSAPDGERYAKTIEVIDALQLECEQLGSLRERGVSPADRDHWYTRLATALTTYITSPELTFTMAQVEAVSRRKQTVAYIFNASGYRTMNHLVSLMSVRKDGRAVLAADKAPVLFAFLCIDDLTNELLDVALAQSPRLLFVLLLGWLNTRAVLTERGETNRARLLQSGALIQNSDVFERDISQMINAWMYSSYASCAEKHEIKKFFNRLLRKLMPWTEPPLNVPALTGTTKPTMLIIHERFTQVHAMYRCYAPSIRSLSRYFNLVALVEEEHIDNVGKTLFDDTILIPKQKNMMEIVDKVTGLRPHVIYYPSLGMSHWTVMLAQLRLAPVQIMTHGHPATSMSKVIDYAYVCEMEGDLSLINSETVIVGPASADLEPHSHMPSELPGPVEATDRQVRVAVNSKVMKLSHRLIAICKRLQKSAAVPVVFSFFPGERGLFFDGLEAAIKAHIPAAEVVKYINYNSFLSEVSKCDLALAAFPFGNTNSTVDTALLGIPTVAHFGPESPAQSDRQMLRSAGLADWLVCRSDEEYFETALELINNPSKRLDALNGLSREDIALRLYENAPTKDENPFAEVCLHLHKNHLDIQKSGKRVIHYKSLLND